MPQLVVTIVFALLVIAYFVMNFVVWRDRYMPRLERWIVTVVWGLVTLSIWDLAA